MSSLKYIEKEIFEKIFEMTGGYVLNFSDSKFSTFFLDFSVNINDEKYLKQGSSKAKRLRTFWELEADILVGKVINSLLDLLLTQRDPCMATDPDFLKGKEIAYRLLDKPSKNIQEETEEDFLKREFNDISLKKLGITSSLLLVLENRLREANKCLKMDIPLSCIFLIGSILEGILLDSIKKSPEKFNQSTCCPKDKNGKVRPFREWKLTDLIDVSHNIGLLKLDIKKFSHHVRDFRNYIHPYQQMISSFHPDLHTAKICFQVLKAAIADLNGER